jgi:RNA polymerase sigma-70 factor (ECF subfamily)
MNATQLSLAGSLMELATGRPAADDLAGDKYVLSQFRRLLDTVWQENEARLARLAVGLGLRGDQAADALQDVYLMAIQQPPAIGGEEELIKWLFRVTVNRCHLEYRRRSRWGRLWSSLGAAAVVRFATHSHPSSHALRGELKGDVERALGALADQDRALVVMRYFSDLNSRQIAEIVGIPEATVRGRLRTARRKLAEELADWDDHA